MKTYWYGFLIVSMTLTACSPAVVMSTPTIAPTATQTATTAPTATQTPTMAPTATAEPTKPPIDPASNFPTGRFVNVNDQFSVFYFGKDGRWAHYYDGFRSAGGRFRVEGDTYFQVSLSGTGSCPVPMSYTFSFDGTSLKFELTEQSRKDACSEQKRHYSNTTYVPVE